MFVYYVVSEVGCVNHVCTLHGARSEILRFKIYLELLRKAGYTNSSYKWPAMNWVVLNITATEHTLNQKTFTKI